MTCSECKGEGRLASWQVEVYQWLIEERSGDELPLSTEESRVRRALDRWLKANKEEVNSYQPEAVANHLGFKTSEALEVAARADERRNRLEDKARQSSNRFLFLRANRSIAPVGYTVVRLDGKARFYWLVGRGDQAQEVKPKGRPDGVKCLGWFGLGSGGAMAFESVTVAFEQAVPLIESLTQAPSLWLFGGSAASWMLTLAGARRVRRRKAPVPTIGLIPAAGQPTALLTCLAYLGSYLGHLRVLDRAYDIQSQRLLGRMRPSRQSESLGIELADGRRIRLVEVANPQGLSAEQIRMMARALDAVMILEQPETAANASLAPLVGDLKASIVAAAKPPPRIGTLMIDDNMDLGQTGAALPLEAARRAFVEDVHVDVDWQAQFDHMWQPIVSLLDSAADVAPANVPGTGSTP